MCIFLSKNCSIYRLLTLFQQPNNLYLHSINFRVFKFDSSDRWVAKVPITNVAVNDLIYKNNNTSSSPTSLMISDAGKSGTDETILKMVKTFQTTTMITIMATTTRPFVAQNTSTRPPTGSPNRRQRRNTPMHWPSGSPSLSPSSGWSSPAPSFSTSISGEVTSGSVVLAEIFKS